MKRRKIKDRIYWMGSVDWDRRLFDALIPLPDGTSYNAFLIEGSEKTVLIDTVDPPMVDELLAQLENVPKLDYIVSLHAEQDHSGSIPHVLSRYPDATTDLYVSDEGRIYEAAKRYYAEIMMPFRNVIKKNLEKIAPYDISIIAPSHGILYQKPSFIINAYKAWIGDAPKNLVVLPYISMHESTKKMVDFLVSSLVENGVSVEIFDLTATDIGKLAITLVDAGTIVVGTPTILTGPHPNVVYATYLANALRPKAKFLSIIGSYGWGNKTVEILAGMIPDLKVEVIEPVLAKGVPLEADFKALEVLAETIATKHKEHGFK